MKRRLLDEAFSYSDGTQQRRVWRLQRVMLNKASMSKFGVHLGEVTLSFTKR